MNLKKELNILNIFIVFLNMGCTAFGPAMMVELKKNIVKELKWLDENEFLEGIAISQLLPGATYVTLSVYTGYKLKGLLGAIASFAGFILPSFSIMLLLSWVYFGHQNIAFIYVVFRGLGAIVVALVLNAVINIGKIAITNKFSIIIVIFTILMILFYNNIFLILIVSALLGVISLAKNSTETSKGQNESSKNKIVLKDTFIVIFFIVVFFAAVSLSKVLLSLAATLFKIGALVFGNGFTMLPLIQQEVIDIHHWLDIKDFLVGVALGQATPGPVTITATFIGYKVKGVLGAIVATLAIYLPSFLFVVITAQIYTKIKNSKYVLPAINGINASFVGLMLFLLMNIGRQALVDISTIILFISTFIVIRFTKVQTFWIVVGGTSIYLFYYTFSKLIL